LWATSAFTFATSHASRGLGSHLLHTDARDLDGNLDEFVEVVCNQSS
jgi:hypothetical protein